MRTAVPAITESAFQRQVADYAKLMGWARVHFRPGLNRRGKWQTAVQYEGAGFPDLIFVRDRVVFAELKTDRGKITSQQDKWICLLREAGQEHYIWRPCDWHLIEKILER